MQAQGNIASISLGRKKLEIKNNTLQSQLYLIELPVCHVAVHLGFILIVFTVTHHVPELPLAKQHKSFLHDFFDINFRGAIRAESSNVVEWGDWNSFYSMRGLKVKGPFDFFSTNISPSLLHR